MSKIPCLEPLHPPQGLFSRKGIGCHLGLSHNAEIWESREASARERWHLFFFFFFPLVLLKFLPLSSLPALPSLLCPMVVPRHLTPKCSCSSWIASGRSSWIASGHAPRLSSCTCLRDSAAPVWSVCPGFLSCRNRAWGVGGGGCWHMPKFQGQKELRCCEEAPGPILLGMWACHPISSADVPSTRFLRLSGFSPVSVTV